MEIERDFILDPSLVLYLPLYKLDGASIMSQDGCGHLCTVTGALWRHNGRYFDGTDDFINCGNNVARNVGQTDSLTLEVWYKTEHISSQEDRFIGKYDTGGGSYWGFYSISATGKLRWYCPSPIEGDADIWDGQFHHIVGVRRGAGAIGELFVDASLNKSGVNTPTDFTWAAPLSIGRWGNLDESYAKGVIGEVRVYERALTPQEIQHNYLATKWRYR